MPLKIVLGLAAAAVDEARKLPETLPAAVSKAPVLAVTTAMGASLRLQQRLTELSIRGEQVLSQLRGTSEQPPSWATFDDPPAEPSEGSAPRAAFDLIDYTEDADEVDDEAEAEDAGLAAQTTTLPRSAATPPAPAKKAAVKKAPAKAGPRKAAPRKSAARRPADDLAGDLATALEDPTEA